MHRREYLTEQASTCSLNCNYMQLLFKSLKLAQAAGAVDPLKPIYNYLGT